MTLPPAQLETSSVSFDEMMKYRARSRDSGRSLRVGRVLPGIETKDERFRVEETESALSYSSAQGQESISSLASLASIHSRVNGECHPRTECIASLACL